jgi:hypothetical protein
MFKNLRDTMIAYIQQETKLKAIWDDESGPRPSLPYVSIKIISGPVKEGFDDIRQDADRNFTVEGHRLFTLSINIWGRDAHEKMSILRDGFERPSACDFFNARRIALVTYSNIINLTGLRETSFEERAQMDVRIRAVSVTKDTVRTIEKIELENQIDGSTTVIQ